MENKHNNQDMRNNRNDIPMSAPDDFPTCVLDDFPTCVPDEFDAYIFDLDGTMLDTLPDLVACVDLALKQEGLPATTTEAIALNVGMGLRNMFAHILPEGLDEATVDRVELSFLHIYDAEGMKYITHYDGIAELIDRLRGRGKKLAILSNKQHDTTVATMDKYYPGCFDIVIGHRDGYPRKPDPTSLVEIIDNLGCDPKRCVYFGDSMRDIETAHAAGCFGVAVTWGYHTAAELAIAMPDAIIDSPDDVLLSD